MKLQDIDFGVGFRNQIRMGVKSKNGMSFKSIPQNIDITKRFERMELMESGAGNPPLAVLKCVEKQKKGLK